METTFYHDENNAPKSSVMTLKKSAMTLDFSSAGGARAQKRKANALLASPDLSLLGLASPELERLIIQQSGMVNTTPTPTQFLFPRSVTEEQEAYARGFVDALEKLHKDDDSEEPPQKVLQLTANSLASSALGFNVVPIATSTQQLTAASSTVQVPQTQQSIATTMQLPLSSFTTTTSLPGSILPTATTLPTSNHVTVLQTLPTQTVVQHQQALPSENSNIQHNNVVSAGPLTYHTLSPKPANYQPVSPKPAAALPSTVIDVAMKEEPQIVPCMMENTDLSDLSPINMETQEVVKLDRKRARNRVAARKCRERKLERISRLEDRVDQLKGQNSDLSNTAQTLRDQVVKLKRQIMEHVESGCQVMLGPNMVQ